MAIVIDSIASLDNTIRRKVKKVIEQLDDSYIIRRPALEKMNVAQIVIQGPLESWLMLSYFPQTPTPYEIKTYLDFNHQLMSLGGNKINYLVISKTGESVFDVKESEISDVTIVEQNVFVNKGYELINKLLTKTELKHHHWILETLFSETTIPSACTTRRKTVLLDSSAQLEKYFLDYDQEIATKLDMFDDRRQVTDAEGDDFSVRLINGVAGCGKTLILINRAILFCQKYPQRNTLLLIHNKPVTEDIKYKFDEYLKGIPKNLTIKTFHAFAYAQRKNVSGKHFSALFTPTQLKPFIEAILTEEDEAYRSLTLSVEQTWEELQYINDYLIENKQTYLKYDRQGRGFSLQQSQRHLVWKLYEKLVSYFSIKNTPALLPSLYIRELCLRDELMNKLDKYDQILVDEAQFFFPSWLALIKKSLLKNGQLFMCADPNQGFLKSRLSWKSVGINVRGRTKKLSYSYRTTREIMIAANALLEYLNESSEDFIKPEMERMATGSKPQVIYTATPQDEQKRFLNEVKMLVVKNDIPLHQIMVLCSEVYNPWNLKNSMDAILGKGKVVNCNDPKDLTTNLGNRIRLMTINCCTGMESGVAFVLGVGELLNKANNIDLTEDEQKVYYEESIRKLYVAMTRAGQKLVLFSTESLPERVEVFVETC